MNLNKKIAELEKRIAQESDAQLKQRFQKYLSEHPRSHMKFEHYKQINDTQIGTTKTGQPIMGTHDHPLHANFSPDDHMDAHNASYRQWKKNMHGSNSQKHYWSNNQEDHLHAQEWHPSHGADYHDMKSRGYVQNSQESSDQHNQKAYLDLAQKHQDVANQKRQQA